MTRLFSRNAQIGRAVPRSSLSATVEVCEPRRLMAAQTLNFTGAGETVVLWTDSNGYNRFGPSAGTTYYFDSSGSNGYVVGSTLYSDDVITDAANGEPYEAIA